MTAMPARNDRISCGGAEATGSTSLGASANRVTAAFIGVPPLR